MRHPLVLRPLVALIALALFTPAALADLSIDFKTVVKGRDKPALMVTPAKNAKKITIVLVDEQGKKQRLKRTNLRANKTKRFQFRQGAGQSKYKASIEVAWADGTKGMFAVDFTAVRVGELKILISKETVDLDGRTLSFKATNPAKRVELTLIGESGDVLEEVSDEFDDPNPSDTPIALSWSEHDEKILRMDLRVTDVAGFYTGMHITPFTIEIPHDEVEFAFGKANIRPEEETKLHTTMGHIKQALAKHGTLLTLRLYVAGYTDTVGSKGSNRELSNRRARSIAQWFRANGLKIPIYYCGFGEESLAVETPDETEEPKNRRALYILSSHTPSGADVPGPDWKRL
ncbi:MAG: hypothetical protein CSA66_07980 [Proteobacteria bacterium]|nr:MAG: hypothetical protein CSA66_07980 [Pseudomonadota bacterium]